MPMLSGSSQEMGWAMHLLMIQKKNLAHQWGYFFAGNSSCCWTNHWRISCAACKDVPKCFLRIHIWEVSVLSSFVVSVLAAGAYVACIWLPETLHMQHHDKVEPLDALEPQIAAPNSQDGKAKESGSGRMESTKSLLKNCVVDVNNDPLLRLFSS